MSRIWRAAMVAGAAFAVPAAINAAIARQRRDLMNALPGDSGEYAWPMGSIAYQMRGEGTPLVLVHGVGAGNSSYEWRHNFEALAEHFRVYALDLPGFGRSERADVNYTADLMVLALMDFLRDVVRERALVVASSLGAAFTVKLAATRPELIERLVLVCPTGLEHLKSRTPVLSQAAYGAFSLPAIGTLIYNGIVSCRYIESYMRENLYVDPTRVTPALIEHTYQSAHQPDAQYALRSFLSGLLNCDLTEYWSRLSQQTLLAWGRHARQTPVEDAALFLKENPNVRLRVFEESALLPHDEEHADFNAAVIAFMKTKEVDALLSAPVEDAALEHPSSAERRSR